MKNKPILTIFVFSFYLFPVFSQQVIGLREEIIEDLLQPYRGGLLEHMNVDDRSTDIRKLCYDENVLVFNDIPSSGDLGEILKIDVYLAQLTASAAKKSRKNIKIEMNFKDLFLCSRDTVVFVEKLFVVGNDTSLNWLKITIKRFPNLPTNKWRIMKIENSAKPSDKDNDQVPDICDGAPQEKGDINYEGFPLKDTDGDEVFDRDDECPNDPGPKKYKGCPDTDGDEIPDNEDRCKDKKGEKEYYGCPDTDYDGIPDTVDLCPTVSGSKENGGCPEPAEELPDEDGDGIPDKFDNCKSVYGLKELLGCPDNDEDGIPDHQDECPSVFGNSRTLGCPDRDNDGIPDYKDNCPEIVGIPAYDGCPSKPQPEYSIDSDGDGVPDIEDNCPYEFGTSAGCPPIQYTKPRRIRSNMREIFKAGVGISGGFVINSLKNVDTDIEGSGGTGFSPYLFTSIQISEKARIQLDFAYSKRNFVFSNHGNDSEYGFSDVYYYNTTDARMVFQDFRGYTKININDFYFGGFLGKTIGAGRKGNIEYTSSIENVSNPNFKYDFFDLSEYPTINGERPINELTYGFSIGYEKIYGGGGILGIGFDYNLSNYFNEDYSTGWLERGDNIDLYPSSKISLNLHYIYVILGYRF